MPGKTMLAVAVLILGAGEVAAQDNVWRWSKAVPAGQRVEIRGVIGDIVATAASGTQVEVVARKRADRGDVDAVTFDVVEDANGVMICAVYNEGGGCRSDGHRINRHDRNDVEVEFEVRVPRGVRFNAQSVTGDVEVTGLDADVRGGSVSGNVRIRTTGLARASSVSGSLDVAMGRADWDGTLALSTVSGDITLEMPDLNADVHFSTVSGSLDSDWPIQIRANGGWGKRAMKGTVGSGGRELKMSTVSGSVELRRAGGR